MLEQINETAGAIGTLLIGIAAIIEVIRSPKRKSNKRKKKRK